MLSPEFKKLESIAELCQPPIYKKDRIGRQELKYHAGNLARNLARNMILFVGSPAAVRK